MPVDPARVQALFAAVLDLPTSGARTAYLDQACKDDGELRERIEALLLAHGQPDSLLDVPVVSPIGDDTQSQATQSASNSDPGETRPDAAEILAFLAPSKRPSSLGRLGHYEILSILGRGGFGTVLKAFDETLERTVAIKVMHSALAATSPPRKRFLREARAAAAVRHENVVHVYEVQEQPVPHLVMEYIAGETLQQKLDRVGPLDALEATQIAHQIARGLAAAHGRGLIHRDIKPGNVMLETTVEPRVRITDFGLARAADDASLTRSGLIAGTPMFMAPEQAQGGAIDHRADLFSLGSVMYTMSSGRPPFRASSSLAVLKRVVEETPRPIREIISEVPEWLCAIIARLHAKNPDDRFASAREVADLLGQCEVQMRVHGGRGDQIAVPSFPRRRLIRRRTWVAAVSVVLVMLLAGAYAILQGIRGTGKHDNAGQQGPSGDQAITVIAPMPAVAPFDAARANQHQSAWAKHLGVPVEFGNSIGMRLRLVPPGEFDMGASAGEMDGYLEYGRRTKAPKWYFEGLPSMLPQHRVKLSAPFFTGVTEVTIGQFRRFVGATGYRTEAEQDGQGGVALVGVKEVRKPEFIWKTPGTEPPDDELPAAHLTWADARAFCKWLSDVEGRSYRLPTEAEWEYACRAGTTTLFNSGGRLPADKANCDMRRGSLAKVGSFQPNAFGLKDMHGNVWEWCLDHFSDSYYATSPKDNPSGPADGEHRVIRGGAFDTGDVRCGSGYRLHCPETDRDTFLGFRVVLAGDLRGIPSAQDNPAVTVSPQRKALEWVLSAGGKLLCRDGTWISAAAQLSANEADVTEVVLADRQLDKDSLRNLRGLAAKCEKLNLIGTGVADEDLAHLEGFMQLRNILLRGNRIRGPGLGHLAKLRALDGLGLELNPLDGRGLAYLKGSKISRLDLYSCGNVDDEGMTYLADLTDLTLLYLHSTRVTDAGIGKLNRLRNLATLSVSGPGITDTTAGIVAAYPNLVELTLDHTNVTDEGIKKLARSTGLVYLNLTNCRKVTDAGIGSLLVRKNFTRLRLGGTSVTSAMVKKIAAAMPGCQVLSGGVIMTAAQRTAIKWVFSVGGMVEIDGVLVIPGNIPDQPVQRVDIGLDRCPGMAGAALENVGPLAPLCVSLGLAHTSVDDDALVHLADFSALEKLELRGAPIVGPGLVHFRNLYQLRALGLQMTPVSPSALGNLRGTELTSLNLHACSNLDDSAMKHLAGMTSLTELDIDTPRITDTGIAELGGLTNLTSIAVRGSGVTDASVRTFAKFRKLQHMTLWYTAITDDGVRQLAPLPHLEELQLADCRNLTDKALEYLAARPTLKSLIVNGTGVTKVGVQKLAAATPSCRIEWDGGLVNPK